MVEVGVGGTARSELRISAPRSLEHEELKVNPEEQVLSNLLACGWGRGSRPPELCSHSCRRLMGCGQAARSITPVTSSRGEAPRLLG